MLVQTFVDACLNMLLAGLLQGIQIVRSAKTVNGRSEMTLPNLVSILFDLYKVIAATIEQIRRFYQFLADGKLFIDHNYEM